MDGSLRWVLEEILSGRFGATFHDLVNSLQPGNDGYMVGHDLAPTWRPTRSWIRFSRTRRLDHEVHRF